jgi:hypothetical protein
MTTIVNRIRDYIQPIVQHLTVWYKQNNMDVEIDDKWEKEQIRQIEICCETMTRTQQSELLYFYSIDEIIHQSTKRYGKPFYMIDYEIIKKKPQFISLCHEGFTCALIEQLLWTELQEHIYFITHSNTIV